MVLSPKPLPVCFEKLPGLWKAVSQREINKEFGERKMWRHSKGPRDPENPRQAVGWVLGVLMPIPAGRSRGGRGMAASRNCWEEAATARREQRALKAGRLIVEPLCQMCSWRYWIALSLRPRGCLAQPEITLPGGSLALGLWSERDPSRQQEGQNLPQQERDLKEKPPGFKTGFSKRLGSILCSEELWEGNPPSLPPPPWSHF